MAAFAHALLSTVFFMVAMPVLALGGFFLMMHGLNLQSDMVALSGLAAIPAGWLVLAIVLKSDLI